MTGHTATRGGMELITLGVAAGPAIRGRENGISSAVVVDDVVYIVDFGLGCTRAAYEASLEGRQFRAGFITHLHSDHIAELSGFLLWNWGEPVNGFTERVHLLGPGQDPDDVAAGRKLAGTAGLVSSVFEAFSYDTAIRVTDEARPPLEEIVRVTEVDEPTKGSAAAGEPFDVYEDDKITVSAILVDHPPVYPALAYRITSDYGSITFSGDTAECGNLVKLARDTDVLVHEAVNLDFYRGKGFDPTFIAHQACSHTTPAGAGRVAAAAGAGRLVLSHLAGAAETDYWSCQARTEFDGPVDVASSGARLSVSREAVPAVSE
ncbi:ribonuclease BN (tRNA processing enzyme) [Halopolyspora algeriensis]|uniref:Ribonuclease BN (tRNA processing enzyme) n=1 Tax=Halopolyspora algeriensis TaxID=1500506 RepID=A0A368VG86_9ACTN|nr:MBL fold metallo-hydrolase [Halopolyspora algeriensis]RCW39663.1 ribonuclease BN (tRNA processing enzyme) [Halopolyspora algeriensis]TQM54044.1 ribonuclease BN (tRNA processing enzyme) [Halopolyspora algeriensis]